jgi:putative NADH-flavin reductase
MNILILGAAGRTGTLLVHQAIGAGHKVTAFVHSNNNNFAGTKNVTVIIGDARNQAELEKALKGQDVVISTLGSTKPSDTVISSSIAALIAAAKKQGVKRVLLMSSFLASPNFKPNSIIKFALRLLSSVISDYTSGASLLQSSGLDYTIVCATRLTNDPLDHKYRVTGETEAIGANNSISRANVADFLMTQLTDTSNIRKSIILTKK